MIDEQKKNADLSIDVLLKDYIDQQVTRLVDERIKLSIPQGKQWSLDDLSTYLNRSKSDVKAKILEPNSHDLDVENGGFVRYPKGKGSMYRMSAQRMRAWLEENLDKTL